MEAIVYELNRDGARLAREAAVLAEQEDGRRRFVAGAIGPTNRTALDLADVNDPGYRAVTFDQLRVAYGEQVRGLIDGGAELILIETIFDTLNAKAAIFAGEEVFAEKGVRLPIMISGTITDLSGRTLSGQTPTAFWHSVRHARAVHRRPQLRARRRRDAAASRRALAGRRHPRLRLSERRPAQRLRPATTRARRRWRRMLARVRRRRARQHRRRLLRHDARHIRAIAEAVAGKPPRAVPEVARR